ncbi:TetR/AcrR family transcriptional regulator [Paraliomyxa miuraensis]|uniref:TetR/AcrR family transcriptional regulator n=1 Tax=Paraliomyxa miuraensis TaxID=376150 RepID=UPI00225A93AF|nr:TetR/AcrR family transcriptional regulator [Paraliomyxa miuraensis]MCX4242695.1 TetR/AcrR family transcriptional regulator [Paraliomyxa miuraensis]
MGRCSDARDRLLATAARLIHERGYTAVSVSDICNEAGLKKGSFYHFFPSKHALVLATLDRFAEYQEARMQLAIESGTSARQQLVGMLTGLYHGYVAAQRSYGAANGCPLGNLAQEMAHRDAELRAKLASIFSRWHARLTQLLELARTRGDLDVPDPRQSAEAIIAYLQGSTLLAKVTGDPEVFLRLAHGVLALAKAELPRVEAPEPEPARMCTAFCDSSSDLFASTLDEDDGVTPCQVRPASS